jgi:hypothetical protein
MKRFTGLYKLLTGFGIQCLLYYFQETLFTKSCCVYVQYSVYYKENWSTEAWSVVGKYLSNVMQIPRRLAVYSTEGWNFVFDLVQCVSVKRHLPVYKLSPPHSFVDKETRFWYIGVPVFTVLSDRHNYRIPYMHERSDDTKWARQFARSDWCSEILDYVTNMLAHCHTY